ncbi:MAG: hypothetical protein ABIO70_31285 [Pseudomonadota bacterium]
MSTNTPAATAQRLLLSFLLAAVVFEGWAVYGLSRRMSRLEARSGVGLSALAGAGGRGADAPEPRDRGAAPPDGEQRAGPGKERPDGPQGELPDRPEGRQGDLPDKPEGAHREPGEGEGEMPGKPQGGPTLERLTQEQAYVTENLDAYLNVSQLDDDTISGLRAEIDRIFSTRRELVGRGASADETPEERRERVEADHERSLNEFERLLGEEEAKVFISEVLRPAPRQDRPDQQPREPEQR